VLAPAGVAPAGIKEMQLTEAILEMVKADLGVAVLARWAVQPHVQSGSLKALRLGKDGQHRTWHAAMRHRLAGADYVNTFVRLAGQMAPNRKPR
jgi:LysR family transcriptional regulator for metE and metH